MKVNSLYVILFCGIACERAPSAQAMKEWSPSDHDQQEPAQATPPISAATETATLAALLWRQQCSTCHGHTGLGDGPAAIATKPPSLASAAWQKATTDAQIAKAITAGKGKMPKFDVPEAVVKALVIHVRSLNEGKTRNDKAP